MPGSTLPQTAVPVNGPALRLYQPSLGHQPGGSPVVVSFDSLPDPDGGLVLYDRVSAYGAEWGRRLRSKTTQLTKAVKRHRPGGRLKKFTGVESGKLSEPRPLLVAAVEYARSRGAVLVAHNLSRFVRPEA